MATMHVSWPSQLSPAVAPALGSTHGEHSGSFPATFAALHPTSTACPSCRDGTGTTTDFTLKSLQFIVKFSEVWPPDSTAALHRCMRHHPSALHGSGNHGSIA